MAFKKGKSKRGSALEVPDKIKAQRESLERLQKAKGTTTKEQVEALREAVSAVDPEDLDPAEKRRRQNNLNRNRGKTAEREVARLFDGERVIGSGAIKHSNKQLLMDVQIRDALNKRDIIAVEVKNTSTITAKGDRYFNLKKAVLDQAFSEADQMEMIGMLYVHFHQMSFKDDDYQIYRSRDSARLIELARWGYVLEGLADTYGLEREQLIDMVAQAATVRTA